MDSFIRIKGRQPRKHGDMNLFSNVKQTRNFVSKAGYRSSDIHLLLAFKVLKVHYRMFKLEAMEAIPTK